MHLGPFGQKVRSIIASESKKRRLAGSFAIEILGNRLLSGPVTFAQSWRRCKLGLLEEEPADDGDLLAAQKSVAEETPDDRETEQRHSTASTIIGSWMKAFAEVLANEIKEIDEAVNGLGLNLEGRNIIDQDPKLDSRYSALCSLIEQLFRPARDPRRPQRNDSPLQEARKVP